VPRIQMLSATMTQLQRVTWGLRYEDRAAHSDGIGNHDPTTTGYMGAPSEKQKKWLTVPWKVARSSHAQAPPENLRTRLTNVLRIVCEGTTVNVSKLAGEIEHRIPREAKSLVNLHKWHALKHVIPAPAPIVVVSCLAALIKIPIAAKIWIVHCRLLECETLNQLGRGRGNCSTAQR